MGPEPHEPADTAELIRRVKELDRRVAALEELARKPHPVSLEPPIAPAAVTIAVPGEPSAPANLLALAGRSLLGLAGAYLLRAAASSGVVPGWFGVSLGIVYCAAWMLWPVARLASLGPPGTRSQAHPDSRYSLTAAVHVVTALLALCPMLWETAVRFGSMPPRAAALILIAFLVLGLVLDWYAGIREAGWFTALAAVGTAVALFLGTYDLAALAITLLAVAGALEFASARGSSRGVRWPAALAADLAILVLVSFMTAAEGLPQAYRPVPRVLVFLAPSLLLGIYCTGIAARTVLRRLRIKRLEIAQLAAAFGLWAWAMRAGSDGSPAAMFSVAVCFLGAAAGCYAAAFARLRDVPGVARSIYAYSTFGLALAAAGTWLILSGPWLAGAWFASALGAAWLSKAGAFPILRIHSLAFTLLAAAQTRLLARAWQSLFGPAEARQPLTLPMVIAAVAAIACYHQLLGRPEQPAGEPPVHAAAPNASGDRSNPGGRAKLAVPGASDAVSLLTAGVQALFAGLIVWVLAGFGAGLLIVGLPLKAGMGWVAATRTAVLMLCAFALAYAGRRWHRPELRWLLYPLMLGASVRLLVEDFPHGRPETLFISLLLYGGTLILLPRVYRRQTGTQISQIAQIKPEESETVKARGASGT